MGEIFHGPLLRPSAVPVTLLFQLIDHADALHRGVEPPDVMVVPEAVARRSAAYLRDVLLPHLLRAERPSSRAIMRMLQPSRRRNSMIVRSNTVSRNL
jgi:hypothetical protein